MTSEQKQKLETQLWKIANELRGNMNADEFRDYILGFVFFKYLSERQHKFANKLLVTEKIREYSQVIDEEDIEAIRSLSLLELGYFLRPEELFSVIAAKGNASLEEESNFILDDLGRILNGIEQSTMGTESEDDFVHLFEDLNLNNSKLGKSPGERNKLIAKVLFHLDQIDFGNDESDSDVLGDAYEYLIAQFASGAGKKAGEFYTPQQVSKVIAKIVTLDKPRLKSVYDPTCGSGSLLLRVAREVGKDNLGMFYGQELNRTTYNLARMNMILHDVHFGQFDIRQDDTLEKPQHIDMQFEAVVANPPFSANWKGKDNPLNDSDHRFSKYGKLAPTSKADFAFVQHMIYQLAENGTMAVVLPHGVLFRGAAEETIRKYIVQEQNYLDAVIGMPPALFYGTGIPACILVFKKCRAHDSNILFIDASRQFEKEGKQNKLLDEHVNRIVETYQERKSVEKYSYVASLDEISENDYNLNIPRYVDTFENEEPVDLSAVVDEIRLLDSEIRENDKVISDFCQQLGIRSPI